MPELLRDLQAAIGQLPQPKQPTMGTRRTGIFMANFLKLVYQVEKPGMGVP